MGSQVMTLQECAAQQVALPQVPRVLVLCLSLQVLTCTSSAAATLHGQGRAVGASPQMQDLCRREPWLSRGWAGAHKCPLCLLLFQHHPHPTEGLAHAAQPLLPHRHDGRRLRGRHHPHRLPGRVPGRGYRAEPSAAGSCGTGTGGHGHICSIPSPTEASSRRSASSCTIHPSPRCSGWP